MTRKLPVLLLVDNNENFLESFRQALQLAVGEARILADMDPVAALRRVESDRVDLVVVDFRFEKMNGWEFVRRVKAVSPLTRTVILTAFPGQFLREMAGRGPSATRAMDLCLAKTQDVGELAERVASLLHESSLSPSLFPDLDRIGRAPSTSS